MIDKLVAYCDYRALRYNNVTVNKCAKSNYYVFGDIMVRISDHAKYGFNKNAKNYDYSFIIQENGQFIIVQRILIVPYYPRWKRRLHGRNFQRNILMTSFPI